MNLFLTKLFQSPTIQNPPIIQRQNNYGIRYQGLEQDTFVKTSPSFKGAGSGTKAGDRLKELDNITCPYSGVKMISAAKMDKLERKINKCKNLTESTRLLDGYKPCMQNLERDVYGVLKEYAISNPKKTANDCLHELKPECLAQLRIDEFKVLDNIDALSNNINAHDALKVRKVTTQARQKILEDKNDSIFKRKDLLIDLNAATKYCEDKRTVNEMWEVANKLPRSTTDFNAFVVKYADRSREEILARLIRPSVASIEHITPKSINPDNTLPNFMLASRDWNSDRGNIPLPEYIAKHPNIPHNCQRYANDIIKSIHKGELKDTDWYPYMLKEKLYNESDGLIDIKINKYKLSEDEAFIGASEEYNDKYTELKRANHAIRQQRGATGD